ncbi:peroxisomal membrane anchor protein conserved region-domain-containing protein [Xylariomycetidae sp. FL0641]|nr:peroxisomal membrane anchor protein conserved region-domain-containing protein [Xylariomycetidae sp. FL0641]
MSDDQKSSVPAWQQSQSDPTADSTEKTVENARRFLQDQEVRSSSREKKREFLKSKGYEDSQIDQLLAETDSTSHAAATSESVQRDVETRQEPAVASPPSDTPPIVTYPEFLTAPTRPPPLITPSRLANILTASGTAWALLYGAARFVVNPMVDSLNESRSDYYEHVNEKLGTLVEKLEGAVSEVPYKNGKPLPRTRGSDETPYVDDLESTYSDPTELFHRDIGTQTSPDDMPASSGTQTGSGSSAKGEKSVIDAQAERLGRISASLRELQLQKAQKADETADLTTLLRGVRDEVDNIAYPPPMDFASIHGGGLGYGRSAEPDDEVRKTKDAIRSVKGLFLSARSFPAVGAR